MAQGSELASNSPREHWGGRAGFVLAAIGSAVGLGNMWRFSYLAAENGGAAFVLLYLAFTLVIGLPVLLAELVVGRGAQRGPVRALAHFGGAGWGSLGILFVGAGFVILAYYSVIAGWTFRYAAVGLLSGFAADSGTTFEAIASSPQAILWHLGFMALTGWIVAYGVRAGIERSALILMPSLFVIVLGLAFYAATLNGGDEGYAYFLRLDVGKLWNADVLAAAAGQAFFSLSLGMGAMLTFASYLDRSHHLPNESLTIAGADFGVAFVAGLVVFPMIFALGLQDEVGESTVGALFITLPHAFEVMGGVGRVIGVFFFAALVVGALTSAVSVLEVVVATCIDEFGWSRPVASGTSSAAIAALGILPARSLEILGWMDQLAGNILLIAGGLGLAIFVGWVMDDPVREVSVGASGVRWFGLWRVLLRSAVPLGLLLVLANALRNLIG